MSDDEVPEMPEGMDMGGMGGMGMDDDVSDDMDDYKSSPDLPEGIKKETVTAAPSDKWKKPKVGDEVNVHYVGTLESDGSEFDSSRSRGKHFSFVLGQGQVIKGWDLGVATMQQGEVAKFTISPEYAYGEEGSPPKIPGNATLVFEIELISWVSQDDLFNDGGVIKAELKEGKGWKKPKDGDEVKFSMKVTAVDGTDIEEKIGFEYTLGSGVLGPLGKTVDKGLMNMKKEEQAQLTCSKDYAYGDERPEGAIINLTLEQVYETKDVSFQKNKTVMKKAVVEGEGYDTPKDSASVKLSVEAATDGSVALASFTPKVLEFVVGNGDVCDALECAVTEMKKGEKSILTVSTPSLAADAQLGLESLAADKVVLTLELQEFVKAKDTWEMSEQEKIDFGLARKDVGAGLFKGGRNQLALQLYKKVADLFNYIDNWKEEDLKSKAKELKKLCELNKAACHLRLKDFSEAKKSCDAVLKDESQNVKAVYRRGQAFFGLKDFQDCIRDCKRVLDLDPQNKEARVLLKQASAGQKEEDKKSKGLFANMCKALGKGPIPEPGKSKPLDDDEFAEDDDEPVVPPGLDSSPKQEEPSEEASTGV